MPMSATPSHLATRVLSSPAHSAEISQLGAPLSFPCMLGLISQHFSFSVVGGEALLQAEVTTDSVRFRTRVPAAERFQK